jgi:hypothetical protein
VGCADCDISGGCESHKGPQREALEAALARVYPSRAWGCPDDEARFGAGVPTREVKRIARALAVACRAPTFWRPAEPDDLCEWVWVLCVGREPALVEVRDGRAPADSESVKERYLRVAFSTVARIACVQEVALELDGGVLRELPQPGVYDGKLLRRMRAIVDLVGANDIEHIDYGLLDVTRDDFDGGEYQARYGCAPTLANYLFYAQPARTVASLALDSI